ncbi:MAG: hypothetical protein GF418_10220 [Chitinivibrionales bacterium]|nr:hypothetical protein [Chitinivibrionales bacterium]MBD3395988.1 hypothetical protein [Chitinivibrionales bacterium]
MRKITVVLLACMLWARADQISVFKLGEFEYTGQTIAVVPYDCGNSQLCEDIEEVFDELMFDRFDDNYLEPRKLRKALKQARLDELDEENMAAVANHLKADVFLRLDLEIEEVAGVGRRMDDDELGGEDASQLIQAVMVLVDPATSKELLTVKSVGKGESTESLLRERFEELFRLAFE